MKLKPKRLTKGDTIGIISPSSPPFYKSDITRGAEMLESWGYKPVLGKNVHKRWEYLAGTDEERASDINEMFSRNDIDAIFVTQGGYGGARTLKHLDFDMIRSNPKIFTGYSDITSLHLAFSKMSNLVTFHGPGNDGLTSDDLSDYTKEGIFKAFTTGAPIGEITMADSKGWVNRIGRGKARGELIGGNLTLICGTLGTPYEIDVKDKILLIEDVDTEPWIFDHMLSHMSNSGKLDEVAGIVVGVCENCVPRKLDPAYHTTFSLEDVLENWLAPLGVPVIYGLPLGHARDKATVPFGVSALVDGDEGRFFIEESGTL